MRWQSRATYPAVCGVSLGDARRRTRRMPRAAYSAWRAACCAGRTVQARAPGARATIGTSATAVTPRADACGAVSGGSVSCWMMPLARQRMFRQPIQLPRCSSTIVLKRLRDICYARCGCLSGGPHYRQRVHKVRRGLCPPVIQECLTLARAKNDSSWGSSDASRYAPDRRCRPPY